MFKVKQTVVEVSTYEVDLLATPYPDWPEEAKQFAREIFMASGNADRLLEMLPGTRKNWLVVKVEALQALYEEFML